MDNNLFVNIHVLYKLLHDNTDIIMQMVLCQFFIGNICIFDIQPVHLKIFCMFQIACAVMIDQRVADRSTEAAAIVKFDYPYHLMILSFLH